MSFHTLLRDLDPASRALLNRLSEARATGRAAFEALDPSEGGLDRLLPHADTAYNQERGAWIHPFPAVTRDLRSWFEGAGLRKPEEWPETVRAVLEFLNTCRQHPEQLEAACRKLSDDPAGRGLTAAMLSPMLNALDPDRFTLWNARTRRLFNDVVGGNLGASLRDYPEANRELTRWLQEEPAFGQLFPGVRPSDVFAAASHQYCRRKPLAREPLAWKIAPGEKAWQWDECLREGFIALGWDVFDDISDLTREEFDARRDELISAGLLKDSETGSEQLWSFLQEIQEGDLVVANRGRSSVVGLGRITGPYYCADTVQHKHRRAVTWDDTRPRTLPPQPWMRTLIRLKPEEYQAIVAAGSPLPPALSAVFDSEEHARWGFALLGRVLRLLGVQSADDPRVTLSQPQPGLLWLSFGSWPVLELEKSQLGLALLLGPEVEGARSSLEPYSQDEGRPEVRMYRFPRETFTPSAAAMDTHVEKSMAYIRELFENYQGSTVKLEHLRELLRAALDPAGLEQLLAGQAPPPPTQAITGYLEPDFQAIQETVRQAGPRLVDGVLRRYHVGLKTRGLVILSGISGSGKTWLAEAYARAVDARWAIVPVAPNWTTNEDLLGYLNPLKDTYHDTAFSSFLREAAAELERAERAGESPVPYHLILDEMNLARVEHYFARFLSLMEVRARHGQAALELGAQSVTLGRNLFVVGTVNIDETTQGFADKVYDRAQLIELEAPRALLEAHLEGASYGEALLHLWDRISAVAPFGFRVLDEFRAYVEHNLNLRVPVAEAVDEQILQKILPKFRGGDPRTLEALEGLRELAEAHHWKLTLAKVKHMLKTHERYGLVSYFQL